MTRLHYSKRLRSALLGRTRGIPSSHDLQPGEMAYFYLNKMRNKDPSQRGRDILKQWHGPAVVLGKEGTCGIYLGYCGGVTKCPPECVRRATATEQLTATEWSDALSELLAAVEDPLPKASTGPDFTPEVRGPSRGSGSSSLTQPAGSDLCLLKDHTFDSSGEGGEKRPAVEASSSPSQETLVAMIPLG